MKNKLKQIIALLQEIVSELPKEVEEQPKFKVGDTVVILDNRNYGRLPVNSIGKIKDFNGVDGYKVSNL